MPFKSGEYFDRKSATGSPLSSRRFSNVRFAPISRNVSKSPARVGLRPIFGTKTSDPSTISAAQIGNAADEGSRGTLIFCGRNSG